MSFTEHWGEYTKKRDNASENLSLEFKKLLVQAAMDLDTVRPEEPHDDSTDAYAIKLPGEVGAMDETMLHTILLHPYIDEMESLIEEISETDDIDDLNPPAIPPVPEKPPIIERLPMVALSEDNARYLLRKSCATILGHVGFDTTKSLALDLLTDVADDFLRQLCKRIHTSLDQTSLSGPSGFPYPLFRAFTEMELDPYALEDYYEVQVRQYNKRLLKSAQLLHDQYANLVKAKVREMVREQQEKGDFEEENIPELHFPALGEEQLQSSLEPGFQMLDSLEHDESLQNMEADEEIVVNDSPSHDYILSTSSDFSSPTESQNRVKKRKLV